MVKARLFIYLWFFEILLFRIFIYRDFFFQIFAFKNFAFDVWSAIHIFSQIIVESGLKVASLYLFIMINAVGFLPRFQ